MEEKRKIDKTQIRLIKMGQKAIGLDDATYRQELLTRYFASSCTELSYSEATDFINWFVKEKGFKIITRRHTRKDKLPPNITALPSPQQMSKINHLRQDIVWRVKPDGYERWLRKFMRKDHITTSREANSVIEAMKGMLTRQEGRDRARGAECYRDGYIRGNGRQW